MCISDISASLSTNLGDYTTVELSQSRLPSLSQWAWRPIAADGNASCSVFFISESVQSKDQNNDCVDFVYLFLGSGSSALNGPTKKIHTDDGFDFICDDNHKILQWLSGNTNPLIGNTFIPAYDVFPGTKLVSWMNDIYQYVTVTSLSFQAQEASVAVNWLTTLTNSYQLENGIVVKGFSGDLCSCAPSASIFEIPCNSTMSFCVSNSFELNLSGSESMPNTIKSWTVTDFDGTNLISFATQSATALDGNLNLSLNEEYGCCTASIRLDLTHLHDSNSAFYGTESIANETAARGQTSKILFQRQDLNTNNPFSSNAPHSSLIGANQIWMAMTLSGSGGVPNGPEIFTQNLGLAEVRLVVPTGSHVSESVDNMVQHINTSASHISFSTWIGDVSASRHGTSNLVLHRTLMGSAGPIMQNGGLGWNAYYINYRYFSNLSGNTNNSPEAGEGNLGSGNGFVLGANGNQTYPGNTKFVSGSLEGSYSASLQFTRSGCIPSNLPQQLNVCYDETLVLGSGLQATSSCCFLLQLNKQPFGNSSSSYCQPNPTPVICLDDVFGPCNFDNIEFNASDLGIFDLSTFNDNKPRCQSFTADNSTMANGSVIISFTASAINSDCLNDASGQPSMSQGHNPQSVLTPGCCPAFSQSAIVYFNPNINAGITNLQCYPTMSLNATSILGLSAPFSWSISGGDGAGSQHTIRHFSTTAGPITPDQIYTGGGNLLHFNTATSNSSATEAYLNHPTASGLYTASVSVTNGPCTYSASVFVKMISASAHAGPDIFYCYSHADGDPQVQMRATGSGLWSIVSPLPPAPQPYIGSLSSPVTKIVQEECSTVVYEWTISSGSIHTINEDTYSIMCGASDQVTVNFQKALVSASIIGLTTSSGIFGTSHPAIQYTNPDGGLLWSSNLFVNNIDGSIPFTFQGKLDPIATEATWSVYSSGSPYPPANSQYNTGADDLIQGIMSEFRTATWPYIYNGTTVHSSSAPATAMPSDTPPSQLYLDIPQGLNPPIIGSHRFHFSSSHALTWNSPIPFTLEQKSPCQCNPNITHGSFTFRPEAGDGALHFVLPTPSSPGLFQNSSNAIGPVSAPNTLFVLEPVLGVIVPKYSAPVVMAFHSGSNIGSNSQSSCIHKTGDVLVSPYLSFSYDYTGNTPPTPPIFPIEKKFQPIDIDSSLSGPNSSAPYWPGPKNSPPASKGITSGSLENLSWRWKSRFIAGYRSNGANLNIDPLDAATITGSFSDTMTSESFIECPTFFPPHRSIDGVGQWPGGAIGADVHRPMGSVGAFGSVASCSIMLEVTMSRLDSISSTVLRTYYASCSLMLIA